MYYYVVEYSTRVEYSTLEYEAKHGRQKPLERSFFKFLRLSVHVSVSFFADCKISRCRSSYGCHFKFNSRRL